MQDFIAEITKDKAGRLTYFMLPFNAKEVFDKSGGTFSVHVVMSLDNVNVKGGVDAGFMPVFVHQQQRISAPVILLLLKTRKSFLNYHTGIKTQGCLPLLPAQLWFAETGILRE